MTEPPPRTQIPDWLTKVGPGWHPLLNQLHADVVAEDPDYEVFQVKEKFGALRVYIDSPGMVVQSLALAAERESATICEDCGAAGEIRTRRTGPGRRLCLCDVCVEKEPVTND